MSSTGIRCIDDLGTETVFTATRFRHYDDDWTNYFGLEDDGLKNGSPPSSSVLDGNLGYSLPSRDCPSPLQIPTREPYGMEAPPKLSPVPAEQVQTFTTLSTHIPESVQNFSSTAPRTLAEYENDLAEELGLFSNQPSSSAQPSYMQPTTSTTYIQPATSMQSAPLQSSSPVFVSRQQNDIHMMQPSTSGTHHNGTMIQQQPPHSQSQQQSCVQNVNGQWFVQTQVQHVQTSSGAVITVVPNYSRGQSEVQQSGVTRQSPQQLSHQQVSMGMMNSQQQAQGMGSSQQQTQVLMTSQQQGGHVLQAQQPSQHQIMQSSKPVQINTMQSQGLPVVQQLLNAPAIPRQQLQQPMTPQGAGNTQGKPKQRASQPRSNGRKKNAGQNCTLGSFLTKANRLAAASNGTPSEANRSSLDSVTLSVEDLEEVSKLSKEMSRLQNLQTVQNVDYSREIKDLENKRAHIFFAALVEQHKNVHILSAASGQTKPASRAANTPRQRGNNYSANSRPQSQNNVQVQHQVQPSTSYERQTVYEAVPQQLPNSRQYSGTYQQVQYQSYQPLNRNGYNGVATAGTAHQQVSLHQQYYTSSGSVRQEPCNTYSQGYEQAHGVAANVNQGTVEQRQVVESRASSSTQQPALVSPPRLRTSAETAAAVREKRQQRASRLSNYFSKLQKSVENVDMSKPFEDMGDVIARLLPFHIYNEPALSDKVLSDFDHDYMRHMVHLNERKDNVEKRLRTILFNEAMKGTAERMGELVMLSLDGEHESRLLNEERRLAAENPDAFVSGSLICEALKPDDLSQRKAEAGKHITLKSQLPFEYHVFSEAEILARDRNCFYDSDTEGEFEPSDEGSSEDELESWSEDEDELSSDGFDEGRTTSGTYPDLVREEVTVEAELTAKPSAESVIRSEPISERTALGFRSLKQKTVEITKSLTGKEKSSSMDLTNKLQANGAVIQKRKDLPAKVLYSYKESFLKSHGHPQEHAKVAQGCHGMQPKPHIKNTSLCSTSPITLNKNSLTAAQASDFETAVNKVNQPLPEIAKPLTFDVPVKEEKEFENPKCRSLKEKLKRHWNEEQNAKKIESEKPLNEKIRLRIRSLAPPFEPVAISTPKDALIESSPSPELAPTISSNLIAEAALSVGKYNPASSGDKSDVVKTSVQTEERLQIVNHQNSVKKHHTNGLLPCPLKIKCNFRQTSENVSIVGPKVAETRPPLKIKITLPPRSDVIISNGEDNKKKEKKKKKKKDKKKRRHDQNVLHARGEKEVGLENFCEPGSVKHEEVHPTCSEAFEATRPPSAVEDFSRGRLLLRLSRKQNQVVKCEPASSPGSSCTTIDTSIGTPTNLVIDDSEPKPKVPKLKIPRIRLKEYAADKNSKTCDLAVVKTNSDIAVALSHEVVKGNQVQGSAHVKQELQDDVLEIKTGIMAGDSAKFGLKKPALSESSAVSVAPKCSSLTLNLFPTSSTSSAPFSPGSDASDVEEEKRLRLQTDNVMNRLNGWGSSVNTQMHAEALRIVSSATFMNPLLSGLMTPTMNPWLTNMEQATRFASAHPFPWLVPPLLPQGPTSQHHTSTSFEKTEIKR